jgi:hypothetical protein
MAALHLLRFQMFAGKIGVASCSRLRSFQCPVFYSASGSLLFSSWQLWRGPTTGAKFITIALGKDDRPRGSRAVRAVVDHGIPGRSSGDLRGSNRGWAPSGRRHMQGTL